MIDVSATLGGPEWQTLGLPGKVPADASPVRTIFALAAADETLPPPLRAILLLECNSAADRAQETFATLLPLDDEPWIGFALGLKYRAPELIARWQQTIDPIDPTSTIAPLAAFVCAVLGYTIPPAISSTNPSLDAALLAAAERWEALVAHWSSKDLAARLTAAHFAGALVGDLERKEALLTAAAAEEPFLSIEMTLDAAFAAGDPQRILELLTRRKEVMRRLDLQEDVLATEAFLCATQTIAPIPGSKQELTSLPRDPAATWSALEQLLTRARERDATRLASLYATSAHGRLRSANQRRAILAAQLLASVGRWTDALDLLDGPLLEKSEGLISGLRESLRFVCAARAGRWFVFADKLLAAARRAHSTQERLGMAALASVTSLAAPQHRDDVWSHIDKVLRSTSLHRCLESNVLLALARAQGRLPEALRKLIFADANATCCRLLIALVDLATGDADVVETQLDEGLLRQHENLARLLRTAIKVRKERWEEAIDDLEQLAARAPKELATAAYRLVGWIWAHERSRPQQAEQAFERALQLAPHDTVLHQDRAALCFGAGDYETAISWLEHATLSAHSDHQRQALHLAAAKIAQHKLSDNARAERSLVAAYRCAPTSLVIIEALADLLFAGERQAEALPLLYDALDLPLDDSVRIQLIAKVVAAHRHLFEKNQKRSDGERALEQCARGLALEPSHPALLESFIAIARSLSQWEELVAQLAQPAVGEQDSVLRALADAYRALDQWQPLAETLEKLASATDGGERRRMLRDAGEIYERLDLPTAAERCYERGWRDFEDPDALDKLAELRSSQGRQADLVQVLERQLSVAISSRRPDLHRRLGALYAKLDNHPMAAKHLASAIELGTKDRATVTLYEEVLREQGNLQVLARLFEDLAKDEESPKRVLELVELYQQLEDIPAALRTSALAMRRFPDDGSVLRSVETLYYGLERWGDLQQHYERWLSLLQAAEAPREQRIELLRKKGEVELFKLGQRRQAAESLARVVELCPSDEHTAASVESLLAEDGAWQQLMQFHVRRASQLPDVGAKLRALRAAAKIATRQLRSEAEALKLNEQIYELDPTDDAAFSFIERKLARMEDHLRLAQIWIQRAESAASPTERCACMLTAAKTYEQVGQIDAALALYDRVLADDEAAKPALEAVARIHEAHERWDEFIEATHKLIPLEGDASAAALLFFKCGSVAETQFSDDDRAESYYLRAVKTSTRCLPAIHSLRELYDRQQRWDQVMRTLKMEAELWRDPAGRSDVLAKIADVYRYRLDKPDDAIRYYRKATSCHGENMKAAKALFDIAVERGNISQAIEWGMIYAKKVTRQGNKAERLDFMLRWASVLRDIGRDRDAFQQLVAAVKLRPTWIEALYDLLEICRANPSVGDRHQLDDLRQEVSKHKDPEAEAVISTALAVLAVHDCDVDRAQELFAHASERVGIQVRIALPWADLLVLLGAKEEAFALVNRALERAQGVNASAWVMGSAWRVDYYLHWTTDFAAAIEVCDEILATAPGAIEIREKKAQCCYLAGRPGDARVVLQELLSESTAHSENPQRAAHWHHMHGLAAQREGQHGVALESWKAAQRLAPSWPYSSLALARAALGGGKTDEANKLLHFAKQRCATERALNDTLRFAAQNGLGDSASDLMKLTNQLVQSRSPDVEDRLRWARQRAHDDLRAAEEALLEMYQEDSSYVPALETLEQIWSQADIGQRAWRARKVVVLADGPRRHQNMTLVTRLISDEQWRRLATDVSGLQLEHAWQLVGPRASRLFRIQEAPAEPISWPEVTHVAQLWSSVFGRPLKPLRLPEPSERLWWINDNAVYLAQPLLDLDTDVVTFVLAMAAAALRGGYGLLYGIDPAARYAVGSALVDLLGGQPAPDNPLVSALGQDELSTLGGWSSPGVGAQEVTQDMIRGWLQSVESTLIKAALLVTDEPHPLAQYMGLQSGMHPNELRGSGLLAAVPQASDYIHFYLSERFEEQWKGLNSA